jgi:hypothetical protein
VDRLPGSGKLLIELGEVKAEVPEPIAKVAFS